MTGSPTYVGAIDTVQLMIMLGNGASPEVFTPIVLINQSRSVKRTAAATATEIPRTDLPSQPAKTVRVITSIDTSITGSGIMDATTFKALDDWLASGAAKNIQALNNIVGGIEYQGPYVITSLEQTGSKHGEMITATVTLDQADLSTTTAVATAVAN